MMLHRTLLSMESFFLLWHHGILGNIVILVWLTHSLQNFAQRIRSFSGTVHFGTVLCPCVVNGEFGCVLLRENVSGILLPRAGGHQLVHGPESKCSRKNISTMMEHSCTSMVKAWSHSDPSLSPQLSCSLSNVFLR